MISRAGALALITVGCGSSSPPPNNPAGVPVEEPPVALNAEPAVQYPPDLYDQRIEGDVVLRLFADSTGRLAAESTRVAESSGYAALDSAAVKGSQELHFVPAKLRGEPIGVSILFPVYFRHPEAHALPGDTILNKLQPPAPKER